MKGSAFADLSTHAAAELTKPSGYCTIHSPTRAATATALNSNNDPVAETGQMHEQNAINSLDRCSYEQRNTQHALRTDGHGTVTW